MDNIEAVLGKMFEGVVDLAEAFGYDFTTHMNRDIRHRGRIKVELGVERNVALPVDMNRAAKALADIDRLRDRAQHLTGGNPARPITISPEAHLESFAKAQEPIETHPKAT